MFSHHKPLFISFSKRYLPSIQPRANELIIIINSLISPPVFSLKRSCLLFLFARSQIQPMRYTCLLLPRLYIFAYTMILSWGYFSRHRYGSFSLRLSPSVTYQYKTCLTGNLLGFAAAILTRRRPLVNPTLHLKRLLALETKVSVDRHYFSFLLIQIQKLNTVIPKKKRLGWISPPISKRMNGNMPPSFNEQLRQ